MDGVHSGESRKPNNTVFKTKTVSNGCVALNKESAFNPLTIVEEARWATETRKTIAGKECGEMLKDLMTLREITVAEMEWQSGIPESTLKRLRAGQEASVAQIIAIAVTLQLPPMVSSELLTANGISLEHNSNKNNVYRLILDSCYKMSIEQVNAVLAASGCEPLRMAC